MSFQLQVKKSDALQYYPALKHEDGLEQSVLGLRFVLDERHFSGGSMRVKCVASLSPLILMGEDRQSTVQNLSIRDMREALLLSECCLFTNVHMVYCLFFVAVKSCSSANTILKTMLIFTTFTMYT